MKYFNHAYKLIVIAFAIIQINTPFIKAEKVNSHGSITDTTHTTHNVGSLHSTTRYLDETNDDTVNNDPEPILGPFLTVIWIILLSPIAVMLRTLSEIIPAFRGIYSAMQESMCESIDFWDLTLNPSDICSNRS
eukprot:CAMPEP_0178950142 /NCGR_PEP_ID=MMETSP0789-20121207/6476_1 /TAXON_ID=3005 /ORGANISM="Rhizosolenia setigera, Strain CCMP 1694" /LENGTH=133 /DNA_ID=CAMNT_0020630811 /DNA_START=58 /DNA_END=462 /DNA_ORIENTATION=+